MIKGNRKKPLISLTLFLVIAIIVSVFIPSANAEDNTLGYLPNEIDVVINSNYTLNIKEPYTVIWEYNNQATKDEIAYKPITSKCSYRVSDNTIATIDSDGVIRGNKLGTTLLEIVYYTHRKTISINVVPSKIGYIAHRGARDYGPENSIYAFQKAVELGYSSFECDMMKGLDGHFFIFHDTNMKKMCGKDLTFNKTVTLENRSEYPLIWKNSEEATTQYIPTLIELLDYIENTPELKMVYLHQKEKLSQEEINRISGYIRARKLNERITVICSNSGELEKYKKDIHRGKLVPKSNDINTLKSYVDWAVKTNVESLLYSYEVGSDLPPSEFIHYAHEHNLKMLSYPIKTKSQVEELSHIGEDFVICDNLLS